jgi:ribosomal RNA assembly protein
MSKKDLMLDETNFKHAFLETSTFSVLFTKQRLNYLKSVESFIKKACDMKKIAYTVDYDQLTMEVSTTNNTRDPYIIVKANDMIQLLGKGVLLEHAVKVLQDDIFSEIIPIHLINSSEKTFERRKARISNPKTIKALELLTKSNILIAGKTACIVGDYKGINDAKNVIVSCFENIHPVFEIKKLMIKRKLEKDNVDGEWDRFMPKIEKTHSNKKTKSRQSGGGMPENIRDRKEDIQMKTGEYYTNSKNLEKDKAREERRLKRDQIRAAKEQKYVVPEE